MNVDAALLACCIFLTVIFFLLAGPIASSTVNLVSLHMFTFLTIGKKIKSVAI